MAYYNGRNINLFYGGVISEVSGQFEEVSTVAELEAKLVAKNLGKIYKFTGPTTGTYTNGAIYEVINE